ncbi:HAD family hydrolase [Psychromicrobium xiongbiense]|uniref:HAD family hydrolase n=1 Tax=Psychromicrobium xiongbiense TaxID=3051184 RepID=UPI0025550609|nr:HAD family hydrolase [Psychromicrobium sp. YIM S02556]
MNGGQRADPAVRAVGFDLDGTLFDHRGAATDGVRLFLHDLGIDSTASAVDLWFAVEQVEFEFWLAGRIDFQEQRRRRLRTVLTAFGVDFEDESGYLDRLFEQYLTEYRRAWRLFPDVVETLTLLRARGYRVGLLTNGNEEQQLGKLLATGLSEIFDVVCISEAIGARKPDSLAFETFARLLGVEPYQCLFIGDDPDQDVVGATAAGMRASLIERYNAGCPGLLALTEAALA